MKLEVNNTMRSLVHSRTRKYTFILLVVQRSGLMFETFDITKSLLKLVALQVISLDVYVGQTLVYFFYFNQLLLNFYY